MPHQPAVLRGLAGAIAVLLAVLAATALAEDAPFLLASSCPPGFQKQAGDVCRLRTLYDQYDSLLGRGVGGTRTELPPRRDGFRAQQIDLGRYLFFDPLLSGDGSVSCASCHQPEKGFADGNGRSIGIQGTPTQRGAPSLWNTAFLQRFFWDGRAESLETQMTGPLYAADEMGNSPGQLLASLRANAVYPKLFEQAFPGSRELTLDQIYTAIAAFEASLVSLNSRYDRYAHGHHAALSAREIAGLNVFRSFVARCAECHTPPLFTNQQLAVIGTPEPPGVALDVGAEAVFNAPQLKGAFKVPTLRNIARTSPYMHSGRFSSLREAVAFYNGGRGHAVPEGVEMQLHWHIWEPELTADELDLLVEFLFTLTDESFVPRVPDRVPSGLPPIPYASAVSVAPPGAATEEKEQ